MALYSPVFGSNLTKNYFYRPLAVVMSMGVVKLAAAINAWAFPMGHKYRERVCSSFAVKQNE